MAWVDECGGTRPGEGSSQAWKRLGGHALTHIEDTLVTGFKERPAVVIFVFKKGHWLSSGGDKTSSRETGGEG